MITGLLSLGAGLQVLTFTIHSTIPSESGFVHFSLSQISRFASLLLFGRYAMPWLGLVALLILAVAAFFAFQGALSETRKDLIGIVLVGGVLALVTFYRMDAIIRNVHPFLMDTRYFLLPHILTAFFFLLAREGDRLARISATLVLALMLLSSASHFVEKPVRDYGWASYCDDMRAGKALVVPIPWDGWQIAVNQK